MASELQVTTIRGVPTGANANQINIASGQTLHAPGHVIQVVTARSEGPATGSTSNTYVNSGLGISITPKLASSKILVETTFTSTSSQGNAANAGTVYKFYYSIAGGSYAAIRSGNGFLQYNNDGSAYNHGVAHMMEEISPSTTSAITFRIYYRTLTSFQSGIQRDWGGVNFRAMEIAQ